MSSTELNAVVIADDITHQLGIPGEYLSGSVLEMSRNVQSGNTQNLKSTVIQRSFPKWSVAERRKTAAAPVRLPAAPASTPGTSQAAAQAGCVYRP